MAKPKFAFQCKNCGALEPASAAGDNALPRTCHICGHGDRDPGNWIVLSELTEEELAEGFSVHGLTIDDVEEHFVKDVEPPQGKSITRETNEGMGSHDKG